MSFVPHPVQSKSNSSNVGVEIAMQLNIGAISEGLDFLEADAIGDQYGGEQAYN